MLEHSIGSVWFVLCVLSISIKPPVLCHACVSSVTVHIIRNCCHENTIKYIHMHVHNISRHAILCSRVQGQRLMGFVFLMSMHVCTYASLPILGNPNCRHATSASIVSQSSSHTVPQILLWQISTRPNHMALAPSSLMAPSVHVIPEQSTPASWLCVQVLSALNPGLVQSIRLISIPAQ